MTKIERAQLVKRLVTMAEQIAEILDILMPDGETECAHPPEAIEHEESMDDDESPWRCTLCGAVQNKPFHTRID